MRRSGRTALVMLGLVCACGEEMVTDSDWALGTYSSVEVGYLEHQIPRLLHFEIRADGVFAVEGWDGCGNIELPRREYAWKYVGGAIEVVFEDASLVGADRWRLTPGEHCNEILVQNWDGETWGEVYGRPRGEVCAGIEAGCESGECFCQTHWCDEAPPMCAEEAAP